MINWWYVYIITNRRNWTLYTGVTNSLKRRSYEHKYENWSLFTKRYWLNKLVYYEKREDIWEAIMREKQIKGLSRQKKIALIEDLNPKWSDLVEQWH